MKEMIIEQPAVHVEIIQSVKTANVALRMTYESSTFTSTGLIENIKYDMNLTKIGNISVAGTPNLTIFELTGMCDIHAYIQTYIHTFIHTYIHTCIYTYIRTYIHTCIHIYIKTHGSESQGQEKAVCTRVFKPMQPLQ